MTTKNKTTNENLMFILLDKILPNQVYCRNGYWSFLPSPSGKPMQLDIYYPELNLAFEYNGKQHYKFLKYFFKTKTEFEELKERDKIKKKLCKDLGIKLIIIDYTKKLTEDYLKMRITKAGLKKILEEQ